MMDDMTGLPSGGVLDSHIFITSGSAEAEDITRSHNLKVFGYKYIKCTRILSKTVARKMPIVLHMHTEKNAFTKLSYG